MSSDWVLIHLIVEGQTEKRFVTELLKNEFECQNIHLTVSLLGKNGGNIKFQRLKEHLGTVKQKDCHISTMFDFFRIDSEWPGKAEIIKLEKSKMQLTPEEKAEILEKATAEKIKDKRFIPHIQMHEFESLLFSEPEAWREFSSSAVDYIQGIVKAYPDPETINDGGETAPSKRLLKNVKQYDKIVDGISIAKEIGLPTMRKKCSHFNQWLTRLESLKPLS